MAKVAALAAARQTKHDSLGRLPSMRRARRIFPSPRQRRLGELAGENVRYVGQSTNASECAWTIISSLKITADLEVLATSGFISASLGMTGNRRIPALPIPEGRFETLSNGFSFS